MDSCPTCSVGSKVFYACTNSECEVKVCRNCYEADSSACKVCVQKGFGQKGKGGKGKGRGANSKKNKKQKTERQGKHSKDTGGSKSGDGDFELYILCFKLLHGGMWIVKSDKNTKPLLQHIKKYELETECFSIYRTTDPNFDLTKRNVGGRFKKIKPISVDLNIPPKQAKTQRSQEKKHPKQEKPRQQKNQKVHKSTTKEIKRSKDWPKSSFLSTTPEGSLKWNMSGEKHLVMENFSKTPPAKQFVQDVDECIQGNYATITCGVHDRYTSLCVLYDRHALTFDQNTKEKKKIQKKPMPDLPKPKPEEKRKAKVKGKVVKPQMPNGGSTIKRGSSGDGESFLTRAVEAEKKIARLAKLYEEYFADVSVKEQQLKNLQEENMRLQAENLSLKTRSK